MDIYLTTADKVKDVVEFACGLKIHLSQTALTIGNYGIYWYGIIITLGMLLGLVFGLKKAKEFGVNPDKMIDCIIAGTVGSFICARAYYVIFSTPDIKATYKTFWDVINIRDGGIAIYGALIGAILFGMIMAKIRKQKLAPLLDITGMGFLIGQAIGRWGNFFNREAFGSETSLPWGMTSDRIASTMGKGVFVHPTFLYESIWCLIGFILLYIYYKHRKFDGEVFLMYLGWYGLERAFVEGLRMDSLMLGKIRISQLVAGICVVFAVIAIIVIRGKIKRNDDYKLYKDTEESIEDLKKYDESRVKNKATIDKKTTEESEETEVDETSEKTKADDTQAPKDNN